MNLSAITPILNVSDVPKSIAWFEALGWTRCFTWNDGGMIAGSADSNAHGPAQFGSVGSGEVEIFLCHDGQGGRDRPGEGALRDGPFSEDAGSGVWMTWWLKTRREVDEVYERAKGLGVRIVQAPKDEPWGVRECRIVHPDGHTFRVSAHAHG